MGQIKFIGSLLMISLFTLAIMNYAITFGEDNDAPININEEVKVTTAKSDIEGELGGFDTATSNSSQAFYKITQDPQDETAGGGGLWRNLITNPVNALKSVFTLARDKIFGGSSAFGAVLTAVTGFIIAIGLMYLYKTIWGKNPD